MLKILQKVLGVELELWAVYIVIHEASYRICCAYLCGIIGSVISKSVEGLSPVKD